MTSKEQTKKWEYFFEDPLPWSSEEKGSPLCHVCNNLVHRFGQPRPIGSFPEQESSTDLEDRTIDDVEHSAKRGCHLCHLIIRSHSGKDHESISRRSTRGQLDNKLHVRAHFNVSFRYCLKQFYTQFGRYGLHDASHCFQVPRVKSCGYTSYLAIDCQELHAD